MGTNMMPTALDKMINSVKSAQEVLRQIKAKTGRRMIGYFHPVVPEELIYAAGFQPVRLFPNFEDSITVGNSYLQTYIGCIKRGSWRSSGKSLKNFLRRLKDSNPPNPLVIEAYHNQPLNDPRPVSKMLPNRTVGWP
jgi:hypothetical protein